MPAARTGDRPAPARGRPLLHHDDEVLTAALVAFADAGYEAMSLRSLGRDLGLSHGALNQRFGSKERLFYAAVAHGFGGLAEATAAHLASRPAAPTAAGVVRDRLRAFLLASAEHPEVMRLMNTLGITPSARLDHVFDHYVAPAVEPLREAVDAARRAEPTALATRELFFLVTHGAAAAFTLRGLSDRFDAADGPLDAERYADHMSEVLVRALGL